MARVNGLNCDSTHAWTKQGLHRPLTPRLEKERLQQRMAQLDREAQISASPPTVVGGLVVAPAGLLAAMTGAAAPSRTADTQASAAQARAIVMALERDLGFQPTDRELEKLGYDIESRIPGTGKLRFIEVKGRMADADSITVTRNEVLTALNKPEDFILAIVAFQDDDGHEVRYVREPFGREPDFGAVSVNYKLGSFGGGGSGRGEGAEAAGTEGFDSPSAAFRCTLLNLRRLRVPVYAK